LIIDNKMLSVPPFPVRQVLRPETAKAFTQVLLDATETAAGGELVPGYHFAGKTGTAQIPVEGSYLAEQTIVTFVGYGPVSDPRLVVLVKFDRPTTSTWAQQTALPVFQQVTKRLLDLMEIAPEE
jgi:cell division protein FtsI (penicillin-binding protein 3)